MSRTPVTPFTPCIPASKVSHFLRKCPVHFLHPLHLVYRPEKCPIFYENTSFTPHTPYTPFTPIIPISISLYWSLNLRNKMEYAFAKFPTLILYSAVYNIIWLLFQLFRKVHVHLLHPLHLVYPPGKCPNFSRKRLDVILQPHFEAKKCGFL